METRFTATSTIPDFGDPSIDDLVPIDYAELVDDEGFINRENAPVPNLNPSRCYPRGLAFRHSVAVFADINAVESRMASVNDASSTVPQRLQRAVRRAQYAGNTESDDGVAS